MSQPRAPRLRRVLPCAIVILGALPLGGCAWAYKNKAEVTVARHVSFGQEFIDLKHALDQGAISSTEYAELKRKLMEQVDTGDFSDVLEEISSEDDE